MAKNIGFMALGVFCLVALAYLQWEAPEEPRVQNTPPLSNKPAETQSKSAFDFYVLSLSWSPSFCASSEGQNNRQQCSSDKSYGFVVHGLWPQNARDYPEFCKSSEPDRVPDQLGKSMFDIMPSMGLIGHQWRKHGSCSGLSQRDYFSLTRRAFERIEIPGSLSDISAQQTLGTEKIEQAFISANAGLKSDQIAVTCSNGRIEDVRICMSRDLTFRSCQQVDQNSCRARSVTLPPR